MSDWTSLKQELNVWSRRGKVADFWIRDDDAISDTPQLRRLIEVTGKTPLALAVIPAHADSSLVELTDRLPWISIWQHGWQHHNWAMQGNSEYPAQRSLEEVEDEIERGCVKLRQLFGSRFLKVFVPPCSGFDDRFFPVLERLGFDGYSAFESRKSKTISKVPIMNAHCEILEWGSSPWFAEESNYIDTIVSHLVGRRNGAYDHDECTGILTHHKHQNEKSYRFLSKLIRVVNRHPAACWGQPLAGSSKSSAAAKPPQGLIQRTFSRLSNMR